MLGHLINEVNKAFQTNGYLTHPALCTSLLDSRGQAAKCLAHATYHAQDDNYYYCFHFGDNFGSICL
jgi:hypothetical protein